MNLRSKIISIDFRAKVFWTLFPIFILSIGVYLYSVLATVEHTVIRERLVRESEELYDRVSELEFKSIALRNEVDLTKAKELGFTEVRNPIYISRSSNALTLNTEQ